MTKTIVFLAAVFILSGCSSTGIFESGGNTYSIGIRSTQIGMGPPNDAVAEAYKEASAFCQKRGMGFDTVGLHVTDAAPARPGSVMLRFRCTAPDSLRYEQQPA